MKVLLIGCAGRMGSMMQQELDKEQVEYLGIDKNNRTDAENFDYNVVVDFSSAQCLYENLLLAAKKKAAIIIATTNHDEKNLKEIEKFKDEIAIFMEPNFSLMFHVLLKTIKNFKCLGGNDVFVQEIHHRHKKDAPSGSCKQILNELNKIGINPVVSCLRLGEVVGEHSISIYANNEVLKISHSALNRSVFCEGVIKACKFIENKHEGLYSMDDLLK